VQTDEIKDYQSFSHWLTARPHATRGWESAMLAMRIAARSLPHSLGTGSPHETFRNLLELTSVCLRAIAVARILALSPSLSTALRIRADPAAISSSFAAAAAARAASDSAATSDSAARSATISAADSAVRSAHAASASASNSAVASAARAASSAAAITGARSQFVTAFRAVWLAIRADCTIIEQSGWESLHRLPLWPLGAERPEWFANPKTFSDALRYLPNQHVWLRWYDRVLNGTPASEVIEMLYFDDALDELWGKPDGFEQATSWIAARLGEIDIKVVNADPELPPESIVPAPSSLGLPLVPTKSGPLGLQADTHNAGDLEQADLYNRLRTQLDRLVEDVPSQDLGAVRSIIDDFMDHPETWDAVQFKKSLWVSGNQLRSVLARHDAVANDKEPHHDKLSVACASALRLPTETWNILIIGDGTLTTLDAIRLGPGERINEQDKIEAAAPVVELATGNPAVIVAEAALAINATIEASRNAAPGINGDQAIVVASATGHQVVRSVLANAYKVAQELRNPDSDEAKFAAKEFRSGAYKKLGEAAIAVPVIAASFGAYNYGFVFLDFVASNSTQLKAYAQVAYQNPQIVQMIDAMRAIWQRYRP
jgi:hypothetical protein